MHRLIEKQAVAAAILAAAHAPALGAVAAVQVPQNVR
jgi:hypothetical protein